MHDHNRTTASLLLAAATTLLLACPPNGVAPAPQSGEVLYSDCQACHGQFGEGIELYGAPAIAGLPVWYVEAELHKFRGGQRGSHPDDAEGLRMRPMSWQLKNERDVKEVATYVSQLAKPKVTPTLKGDPEKGKISFATCQACHGPDGKGNQALNAPPIAGQHDWYLVRQITKFKQGVRGTLPGDATGATMRPMAMTLPDDAAVHNVVAYIQTLPH